MNRDCTLLAESLDALRAGRFDALAPDRIAALEAHLNSCRACAATIGAARPSDAIDSVQIVARQASQPTAAEWGRVWGKIEEAVDGRNAIWSAGLGGILRRTWRPLAGLAACVMMVVAWKLAAPLIDRAPPAADDSAQWQFADTSSVEVLEFEVGDGMSAVVGVGGAALWVIEPDEGDSS